MAGHRNPALTSENSSMKTRILATLFALPFLLAAGPAEPTGDLAKLQGRWVASAGRKHEIPVTLEIRGSNVTLDLATPLGIKIHAEGQVKIDESARPKTLDWVGFTSAEGQDLPEILSIYVLDGDALKLANSGPNNPRPKEFVPGEGVLSGVVEFTRHKVAAKDGEAKKTSVASIASAR